MPKNLNKKKWNIALAAGGTAGHVFPALAIAKIVATRHNVCLLTDNRGLKYCSGENADPANLSQKTDGKTKQNHEQLKFSISNNDKFQQNNNIKITTLPISNSNRTSVLRKISFFISILLSFFVALYYLWRHKIDIVISFGGYSAFPTAYAAIVLRRKLVLHEQNTVLGMVHRFCAPYADLIATSFSNTIFLPVKYHHKVFHSGMITRPNSELDSLKRKHTTGFANGSYRIFILGGSQGASAFSLIIPEAIKALDYKLRRKIHIVQQARSELLEQTREQYATMDLRGYEVAEFFDDAIHQIAIADLVIARAGASTIAEVVSYNVPAILVPLPNSADNHQYYNAMHVARGGGIIVLQQNGMKDIDGGTLKSCLDDGSNQFNVDNLVIILSKMFVDGEISKLKNIAKNREKNAFYCDNGARLAIKINGLLI